MSFIYELSPRLAIVFVFSVLQYCPRYGYFEMSFIYYLTASNLSVKVRSVCAGHYILRES